MQITEESTYTNAENLLHVRAHFKEINDEKKKIYISDRASGHHLVHKIRHDTMPLFCRVTGIKQG